MPARACSTAFRSTGWPSASFTRLLTSPSLTLVTPRTAHFSRIGRSLTLMTRMRPFAVGLLLDDYVVELPRLEERRDGALDVAVVDRLLDDETGRPDDLGRGEPPGSRRRRCCRRSGGCSSWATSAAGAPSKEGHGGAREVEESLHPHSIGGGRAGSDGAGAGRPQAWVPVSARKASRSPSGATSTSISSPRPNSPMRIFSLSGSSMYRWIDRLSGRAP